jgi:hypothetical protein
MQLADLAGRNLRLQFELRSRKLLEFAVWCCYQKIGYRDVMLHGAKYRHSKVCPRGAYATEARKSSA